MSRFGWAYVNSLVTGAVANGPTNSVQFNSGSQVLSGSSNFTFNPATNTLVVTGTISASVYQGISATPTPAGSDKQIQYNSGSTLGASSNLTFDYTTNTLFLTGTLRADNLIVSSSQILKSGSTIFGDDLSDTHQFTGSILGGIVSGTIARFITITGSTALITNITGNLFGTASFATLAATASYYNTSSLLITASVSGAVLTFTKGDGSTFPVTVNNVTNAQTASYASNADLLDNRDSTTFAGTGSNTFNGNQIITGTLDVSSTLSGTTAQFTTITGSIVTGSTALFTTLTASAISANSIPAFGANQTIQYNNAGVLNGSSNLTFDGTQVRITGSVQVVSGSTIVAEMLSSGVRTTGKPVLVRNASSVIVGVMDESGIVSGSIGSYTTITGSSITSSNEILVANNITVGANILGSGAFKGGYLTYTGSFTVPTTSYFVGIISTGSVITASLSNATSYPSGQTLIFKDIGGNAAINNIRIQPSGSQTIDGATSLVISSTSGSATLISNGVDGFYIIGLT